MSIASGRMKMSGHYIRRRLRFAPAARRMAGFALLLLLASMLFFRLGAIDGTALLGLLALVAGLAGLAALIAVGGLVRVWRLGAEGGGCAVGALVLAMLVLAPFGLLGLLALDNPPSNRAVTDGMTAPGILPSTAAEEGIVQDAAAPAASAPTLSGRRFEATAAQIFGSARLVLDDEGWEVAEVVVGEPLPPGLEGELAPGDLGVSGTVVAPIPTPRASIDMNAAADPLSQPDADQYTIRAVARDFLFALPSDVEIRIVEEDGASYVDMRSVSRAVPYDLGQNRRFIEDFLIGLDDAMAGVGGIASEG